MRAFNRVLVASVLTLAACGPGGRQHGGNCPGLCTALGYQECNDGAYSPPVQCATTETCDPNLGCVVCAPDQLYCGGDTDNSVLRCNHDGTGGTLVMDCPADNVCSGGACKTPCDAALDHPSNVGCDFWAADLDNEAFSANNAAAQQFAIVAANNNDYPVVVTVTKNAN